MSVAALPEPTDGRSDTKTRFLDYLDYYRSAIESKVSGLSDGELRASRLPSGWTPLELLKHVVFMERRWLLWGFAGEQVEAPWGDHAGNDPNGQWQVAADDTLEELLAAMRHGGEATRAIVEGAELAQPATTGGRFASREDAPTLEWVLFHVLQEYARHAGHLDIVRELADGTVGE
jgi:uncharacterized damage-inducible protein DinB